MERLVDRGPALMRLLDAVAARRRRARLHVAAVRMVVWTWTAIAVAVALEWVGPVLLGHEPPSVWWLPLPVAAALVTLGAWQIRRREPAEALAREVDARFGLQDATVTALAVEDGRISGPLSAHVMATADGAAARVLPQVPDSYPVRVPTRVARRAVVVAVVAGLAIVGAVPLRPASDSPTHASAGVGPEPGPTRAGGTPLAPPRGPDGPQHGEGEGPPEARAPEVGDTPDLVEPPEAEPEATEPDDAPLDPPVAARILTSKTRYRQGEPVVVVVTGLPTATLEAPVDARILLLLDDEPIDPGERVRIDPEQPGGAAELIDLGRNPAVEERLTPGEHRISALLVLPTGEPVASNEETFVIEGEGDESEDPQTSPEGDPPPDTPEPPPPGPTGAAPPPTPPDTEAAGGGFPDEAKFDRRAVVPLFGEDETVAKQGLRLVIRPSGGLPDPVRRAELEEVLPEARWRAEQAVERGRVRPEDRELVLRYFRRLERLGR